MDDARITPKGSHYSDEIRCPYCGHEADWETQADCTTYHGEDGEREVDCGSCERTYAVDEFVRRSWTTGTLSAPAPATEQEVGDG